MPHDSFIDPLFSHVRNLVGQMSKRRGLEQELHYSGGGNHLMSSGTQHSLTNAPFTDVHDFVISHPTMIEKVEYIITSPKTVLEILKPFTKPEAAMDSSARDPPPRCHPGTRVHITTILESMIDKPNRSWDMVWLHGSAGTGKSAVAQTLAERCAARNRLGAAFFFSRPNKRNKAETVVPTLAYQLAYHCPAYKSLITHVLTEDPDILEKAMHIQFKHLIIEPFAWLQQQGHIDSQYPFLVVLDGLDECDAEKQQRELVKMINGLVTVKRGFPIFWLICSRPEPHLMHTFLRLPDCGKEELALDNQCREDIEKYLRDGFQALKEEYPEVIRHDWPPEEQLDRILHFCSYLFAVASVTLNYISDPAYANPAERLTHLIHFLERHEGVVGPNHPLTSLDVLYTHILSEIPEEIFPITQRILSYSIYHPTSQFHIIQTCQTLCNLLRLDQSTFYAALHKLHSVLLVPPPEDALNREISFCHASFTDFLRNPTRAGRYAIDEGKARIDIAKTLLSWHELDTRLFHTKEGIHHQHFTFSHNHGPLPSLAWVSKTNRQVISHNIATVAGEAFDVFRYHYKYKMDNQELLQQVYATDFRYVQVYFAVCDLLDWIFKQDPSSTFIHTEPLNEVDYALLDHLWIMTGGEDVPPSKSLSTWREGSTKAGFREYFFLGSGKNTVLFCLTATKWLSQTFKLNADNPPSEKDATDYQDWLVDYGWRSRGLLRD